MKARSDLEVERQVNAEMRRTVGAEKQARIGAAMSDMLTDLLRKQAETLAAKAKLQEKDRGLQYREHRIAQLEEYLSDGQKQLKHQLEQQGIRPMSTVDQAFLRRKAELEIRHKLSDIEGKISIQVERLRHQEAAQKIREQQYKTLIRDTLENEVHEQLTKAQKSRTIDVEASKAAYERGLAEGKQAKFTKASEIALKHEFLKGYAACYRSQTSLYSMRIGQIPADSSELAFLYDPTHPENPHNIGLQMGRLEVASKMGENSTMEVAADVQTMEESAACASTNTTESSSTPTTVIQQGHSSDEVNNTDTTPSAPATDYENGVEHTHQMQQARRSRVPEPLHQVQRLQQEETARK